MKGVFDESRPVVSVHARHALGADGGRRADEAEDARDGTGPPLRDALDARWRRRRKVRARERGVI